MTITKKEFAKMFAEELDCTIQDANTIVDLFTGLVAKNVSKGIEVNFQGFGKFKKTYKQPRIGFNPKTKSKMEVEGFNTVLFKVGSTLKNDMNKTIESE